MTKKYFHPQMTDDVAPPLEASLSALREKYVEQHAMWKGDFISKISPDSPGYETDPEKRWRMLELWAENMLAASMGFRQYESAIKARTYSIDVQFQVGLNDSEEMGFKGTEQDPRRGKFHYPQGVHTVMIHQVVNKIGAKNHGFDHRNPAFLPSTYNHVQTHHDICRSEREDVLKGLGMLLYIECLTEKEFGIVERAFQDTWPKVYHRIKAERGGKVTAPVNYFDEGHPGQRYFKVNREADNGKHSASGELVVRGHDQLMMLAVQAEMLHRNIDITNAKTLEKPLSLVEEGMKISSTCRAGFMQGVHDNAYKVTEIADKPHASPALKTDQGYKFTLNARCTKLKAKNDNTEVNFTVNGFVPEGDAREGGESSRITILPVADLKLDGAIYRKLDLLSANTATADKIREICNASKLTDVDPRLKIAFAELEKQIPKAPSKG